jgi:hypothetical protein
MILTLAVDLNCRASKSGKTASSSNSNHPPLGRTAMQAQCDATLAVYGLVYRDPTRVPSCTSLLWDSEHLQARVDATSISLVSFRRQDFKMTLRWAWSQAALLTDSHVMCLWSEVNRSHFDRESDTANRVVRVHNRPCPQNLRSLWNDSDANIATAILPTVLLPVPCRSPSPCLSASRSSAVATA